MCIVSYIPTEKGFYFTSNRDENQLRKTLIPRTYSHGIHRLTYPKDMEKVGSWLAIHANRNRLGCILNGKHLTEEEKKNYSENVFFPFLGIFSSIQKNIYTVPPYNIKPG